MSDNYKQCGLVRNYFMRTDRKNIYNYGAEVLPATNNTRVRKQIITCEMKIFLSLQIRTCCSPFCILKRILCANMP